MQACLDWSFDNDTVLSRANTNLTMSQLTRTDSLKNVKKRLCSFRSEMMTLDEEKRNVDSFWLHFNAKGWVLHPIKQNAIVKPL